MFLMIDLVDFSKKCMRERERNMVRGSIFLEIFLHQKLWRCAKNQSVKSNITSTIKKNRQNLPLNVFFRSLNDFLQIRVNIRHFFKSYDK